MLKRRLAPLLLAALSVWLPAYSGKAGGNAPAPLPAGTIAYIRHNTVWLAPAGSGAERQMPRSSGAALVSLSPVGGTLLYFVALPGRKGDSTFLRGYVSRAPYTQSEPLPAPLDFLVAEHCFGTIDFCEPRIVWTPDGSAAFIHAAKLGKRIPKEDYDGLVWQGKFHQSVEVHGAYQPATRAFRSDPFPTDSASRDGRVTAWATNREIRVREGDKRPVTLFSVRKPQPLFDALRRAASGESEDSERR